MEGLSPGRALRGVKVLDLTQFEAGTSMTQALAWYGADVIKIEEPTKGDQSRSPSSNVPGLDSHYFLLLNCNKRSVTLNLRDERGKEMLRAMIPQADIFAENYAPGAIERLGFSYEEVRELNPGILYVQVKGFGSESPYAGCLAFDNSIQAAGGALGVTGNDETGPIRPGPTVGDTGTGLHALVSVLAALYQKRVTGRGQRIEVAMQEVVVGFCRTAFAQHHVLGHPPRRVGSQNALGSMAPSNVYACKPFGYNDYCYVACLKTEEEAWRRLAKAIGREDLLADPRFSTPDARVANLPELDRIVGEWTRNHTKYEAMRILGEAGVHAGAVMDTLELTNDPPLREREIFVTVQHPRRGDTVVAGWPVKLSDSPVQVVTPPLLGQHNAEVYREWLSLDEAEIARLKAEKVI